MKTVSAGLATHLASSTTTLATCWKVTRQDGVVLAATDHDVDIAIGGVTYLAATGYTPSSIQTSGGLSVDNLEIQAVLDSSSITVADLNAGLWDYANVEIFRVNWRDVSQGVLKLRKGRLGEVKAGRSAFTAELRGLTQAYSRSIGRVYQAACDAEFADKNGANRCTIDPALWTVTGTVEAVANNRTITDSTRTEAGAPGSVGIVNVSAANPAVVTTTAAHGLATGATVYLAGIAGAGFSTLNGQFYVVTVLTTTTFSIDVNTLPPFSTGSGSGGTATPPGSGYFDGGVITFTSGLNTGLKMEVKAYSPGSLTLQLPMPYAIAVGDTYSLIAGCDKLESTCKTRFSNIVNFRGFAHLPGNDKILRIGGGK